MYVSLSGGLKGGKETTHCKKDYLFSRPQPGYHYNQTLPGGELLIISGPGRVWLVTPRLGTGKIANPFFTVQLEQGKVYLCGYMNENAQANGFSNRKGLNVFHCKQLGKYRKGTL